MEGHGTKVDNGLELKYHCQITAIRLPANPLVAVVDLVVVVSLDTIGQLAKASVEVPIEVALAIVGQVAQITK